MSFRQDLDLAADWADDYLRRVGELPVAAQVQPGEVRARLPEAPPEQPEPFEAMLRDLDEVILPGLTHWNHPRFFAWIANTGSEPGVLAELLVAATCADDKDLIILRKGCCAPISRGVAWAPRWRTLARRSFGAGRHALSAWPSAA